MHKSFLSCFLKIIWISIEIQKTLEAPQAARLRLVLPGSEVLAPALDVRDCPFSGAVPVSGFKRNHCPSPEVPVAMVVQVVGSWQETAKARSLPSTVGNGPVILVFCQRLSFREKGRLWPLGSCPLPGGSCRAVPQKATLELALLLRERTVGRRNPRTPPSINQSTPTPAPGRSLRCAVVPPVCRKYSGYAL